MEPAEAIVALADAGDADGIRDRLAGLDEPARRALAATIVPAARDVNRRWLEMARGDERLQRRVEGLGVALLGCASLSELQSLDGVVLRGLRHREQALAVPADRAAPWLAQWVEALLQRWPGTFGMAREMVRAGTIPLPRDDAYVLGMIGTGPGRGARVMLDADPELLDLVPRLFEIEGGGELSLAAVDKYTSDERGWAFALHSLAEDGRLSRGELLDRSLDALVRDFAAFRAGWFSRLHERLEPTLDERAERLDRYVRLLGAPVPATVSFALAALTALAKADRLTVSRELVEALGPALRSERKATVRRALALLRRADGAAAAGVALAATGALGHPDAGVQGEALDLVGPTPPAAVRERIGELAGDVSPTLRDRVAALIGAEARAPEAGAPDLEALAARAGALPAALRALAGVDDALTAARGGRLPGPLGLDARTAPALDPAAAVAPIETLEELIDVWAAVLEGAATADEGERALDGLARLCAERPPDFAARTSALRRRAQKPAGEPLALLVRAWLEGAVPPEPAGRWFEPEQAFADRVAELVPRVAAGDAHQLLAAPTHAGGWIDPRALVARAAADPQPPAASDLLQALCRLAPEHRDEALAAADGLVGPAGAAIRAALGGPEHDGAFAGAVAVARGDVELAYEVDDAPAAWPPVRTVRLSPPPDGAIAALRLAVLAEREVWGPRYDALVPLTVERLAGLWPAGDEALAAHGAQLLATNVDGFQVVHGAARFLEIVADAPDRPVGELGRLMLVFGLGHAFAAERTAAVDAVVAAIGDARVGADELGAPLARLLASGVVRPTRLAATLGVVARESVLHAETVRLALERALELPEELPRGMHALFDLLNELTAAADAGVDHPPARATLERLSGGSKAAKLARALLERSGASRRLAPAAAAAAEARIARAERWAAWGHRTDDAAAPDDP